MSTVIPASQRRVQLRDDHDVTIGGKQYLIGPYSLGQRQRFLNLQVELMQTRYPKMPRDQAKDAAYHKWRNLVISTIQDEVNAKKS